MISISNDDWGDSHAYFDAVTGKLGRRLVSRLRKESLTLAEVRAIITQNTLNIKANTLDKIMGSLTSAGGVFVGRLVPVPCSKKRALCLQRVGESDKYNGYLYHAYDGETGYAA